MKVEGNTTYVDSKSDGSGISRAPHTEGRAPVDPTPENPNGAALSGADTNEATVTTLDHEISLSNDKGGTLTIYATNGDFGAHPKDSLKKKEDKGETVTITAQDLATQLEKNSLPFEGTITFQLADDPGTTVTAQVGRGPNGEPVIKSATVVSGGYEANMLNAGDGTPINAEQGAVDTKLPSADLTIVEVEGYAGTKNKDKDPLDQFVQVDPGFMEAFPPPPFEDTKAFDAWRMKAELYSYGQELEADTANPKTPDEMKGLLRERGIQLREAENPTLEKHHGGEKHRARRADYVDQTIKPYDSYVDAKQKIGANAEQMKGIDKAVKEKVANKVPLETIKAEARTAADEEFDKTHPKPSLEEFEAKTPAEATGSGDTGTSEVTPDDLDKAKANAKVAYDAAVTLWDSDKKAFGDKAVYRAEISAVGEQARRDYKSPQEIEAAVRDVGAKYFAAGHGGLGTERDLKLAGDGAMVYFRQMQVANPPPELPAKPEPAADTAATTGTTATTALPDKAAQDAHRAKQREATDLFGKEKAAQTPKVGIETVKAEAGANAGKAYDDFAKPKPTEENALKAWTDERASRVEEAELDANISYVAENLRLDGNLNQHGIELIVKGIGADAASAKALRAGTTITEPERETAGDAALTWYKSMQALHPRSEPVKTEPVVEQPVVQPPVVQQPAVTSPVVTQPVTTPPVTTPPVVTQPVVTQPEPVPVRSGAQPNSNSGGNNNGGWPNSNGGNTNNGNNNRFPPITSPLDPALLAGGSNFPSGGIYGPVSLQAQNNPAGPRGDCRSGFENLLASITGGVSNAQLNGLSGGVAVSYSYTHTETEGWAPDGTRTVTKSTSETFGLAAWFNTGSNPSLAPSSRA
jgi:hypothetical protein